MQQFVLEHQEQGLLTLTLNQTDRRNALTPELIDALLAAVERAAADATVRGVLLKGAGGTFSVGGDVKSMAESQTATADLEELTVRLRRWVRISELLHEMPKPTIAMIEGAAAGAGLSLALACDFRIASNSAKIITAFAKVALSGDFGGSYFLTKLVGSAKARELYMMSPLLSGSDAFALGLITRVVPDAELETSARAFAMELAAAPTLTMGYIKKNINAAEAQGLKEVLDIESLHHSRCMATNDHSEAANAFLEKRSAVFSGR